MAMIRNFACLACRAKREGMHASNATTVDGFEVRSSGEPYLLLLMGVGSLQNGADVWLDSVEAKTWNKLYEPNISPYQTFSSVAPSVFPVAALLRLGRKAQRKARGIDLWLSAHHLSDTILVGPALDTAGTSHICRLLLVGRLFSRS
eukprot:scaffold38506_cov15-Tisochrysis_lutea.AAC.1